MSSDYGFLFLPKTSDIVLTNPAEVVFSFSYNVEFQFFKGLNSSFKVATEFFLLGKIRKNFSSLFSTFIRRNILLRCFVDSKMIVSSSLSYEFSFSLLCSNIKSLMSTFYSRARFFSEPDLATFSLASLSFSTLFFMADFRDAINIAYFIISAIYFLLFHL